MNKADIKQRTTKISKYAIRTKHKYNKKTIWPQMVKGVYWNLSANFKQNHNAFGTLLNSKILLLWSKSTLIIYRNKIEQKNQESIQKM